MRRGLFIFAVLALFLGTSDAALLGKKQLFHSVDRRDTVFAGPEGTLTSQTVTLWVQENRRALGSRLLPLKLLRLPAHAPSGRPPVLIVASVDGDTGNEFLERRWALVEELRGDRDVVVLDPRARGWSAAAPRCRAFYQSGPDRTERSRAQCLAYWRTAGYDPDGYTRDEIADDVAAAATALGGKVVVLADGSSVPSAMLAIARQPKLFKRAAFLSPALEGQAESRSLLLEGLPTMMAANGEGAKIKLPRTEFLSALPWMRGGRLPEVLVITGTTAGDPSERAARRMTRHFKKQRSMLVVRNSGSDPIGRSSSALEMLVRFAQGESVPSQSVAVPPETMAASGFPARP
jgi:pimeloyl-ACP methyl ester carboxylesterase